jgi:hypothetical protein
VDYLHIDRDYEKELPKRELKRQYPDFAALSHVDRTVDRDTVVTGPDREIVCVLLCNVFPQGLLQSAFERWKTVKGLLTNRPSVVGVPSRAANEMVAKKLQGRAAVLGWYGPDRPSPLSERHPDMLEDSEGLTKLVAAHYAREMPRRYAFQWGVLDPRYRLAETAFSSIYIITKHRCTYHRDSGNLKGAMTCLVPMGNFYGGELVLLSLRICIAFKPGGLLLFNPGQLHGILPIHGERLSAAFYCAGSFAKHRG